MRCILKHREPSDVTRPLEPTWARVRDVLGSHPVSLVVYAKYRFLVRVDISGPLSKRLLPTVLHRLSVLNGRCGVGTRCSHEAFVF